jgi:tRNA nucleotidyltransferase (CCA-adding enzyme)
MHIGTTHLDADLDGLAALVALRLLDPRIELVLPSGMEPRARGLWEELADRLPPIVPLRVAQRRVRSEGCSALIAVDTAHPDRLGEVAELLAAAAEVRAWDTHPPSPSDLPRVSVPRAGAATSVLVLELAAAAIKPDPSEATLMLAGIHQDTGHLCYPGTTNVDHRAAAHCLDWGADLEVMVRHVRTGLDRRQLALAERMAAAARCIEVGGITVALVPLDLTEWEPDLAAVLTTLRQAEGWPAALLIVAVEARVHVIGRSVDDVDVGAVLRRLGGGGHAQAASAVLQAMDLVEGLAATQTAVETCFGALRTAGQVAIRQFVAAPEDLTVHQASQRMNQTRINALPLVATGQPGAAEGPAVQPATRWVGLVSRQEVDAALRHGLGDLPVGAISAHMPARVGASTPVDEAIRRILVDSRRLLLVGDEGAPPVGILTRSQLFRRAASLRPGDPTDGKRRAAPKPNLLQNKAHRQLGARWDHLVALGALGASHGLHAWLVGGPVRDLLGGRTLHDLDLVVEAETPGEAAGPRLGKQLVMALGGQLHVHEAFGTATWMAPEAFGLGQVDLATARAEHYDGPAALPQVLHADLERDLGRRDFSINAMALGLSPALLGVLHDPHGGRTDLEDGQLRVLHGLSFHDDPCRAFRAARFAARFDLRLAPQTHELLQATRRAGVLERLGIERLGHEIDRILGEADPVQALRLLRDWNLLELIHPAVASDRDLLVRADAVADAWHEVDGARRSAVGAPSAPAAAAHWLSLAVAIPAAERASRVRLIPGDGHDQQRFLHGPERVRTAVKALDVESDAGEAGWRLAYLDDSERVVAQAMGGDGCRRWCRWFEAEGRMVATTLDGHALMAAGIPQGPLLGRALLLARKEAWRGGGQEAQLTAALTVLDAAR